MNPRLVYQYGAAYGSTGPYRRQPAIDHVIAAFAGTTAHQAGDGEVPLKEQGADPVSSLGVGVSLLLGLRARDRTGDGQYVESAMIQSNLHMNIEDALDYHGKPARRRADRLQRGTGPTHRLYETAAPGLGYPTGPWVNPAARWIFLSVVEDDDFDRFCTAADRGDLMADRRFATRGARERNGAALETDLEALFQTRPAREWESSLLGAGVGCVVADEMSFYGFLHRSAQARSLEMVVPAEHAAFGGSYCRPAPAVTLSRTPGTVGSYCEVGEHTRAVLREFGYDDETMAQLKNDGVITWPDGQDAPGQ